MRQLTKTQKYKTIVEQTSGKEQKTKTESQRLSDKTSQWTPHDLTLLSEAAANSVLNFLVAKAKIQ